MWCAVSWLHSKSVTFFDVVCKYSFQRTAVLHGSLRLQIVVYTLQISLKIHYRSLIPGPKMSKGPTIDGNKMVNECLQCFQYYAKFSTCPVFHGKVVKIFGSFIAATNRYAYMFV